MNPKIAAILVMAMLSVSIVVTGVAAIAAAQGTSQPQLADSTTGELNEDDGALVRSFKLVCPFH